MAQAGMSRLRRGRGSVRNNSFRRPKRFFTTLARGLACWPNIAAPFESPTQSAQALCYPRSHEVRTEGEGFEPSVPFDTRAFQARALDRYANPPCRQYI